jgi:hypothetical protein
LPPIDFTADAANGVSAELLERFYNRLEAARRQVRGYFATREIEARAYTTGAGDVASGEYALGGCCRGSVAILLARIKD